ncbi:hypothetical protein BU26DRAFT_525245 [Trematosphaeria pertusa]|uniref:Uncharacterized protein n=1 Tax=Trematosphaeria pertusa TaxID=390896 RepID=A0A6A6HV38_9PLEO|nr:uncharacterized protein BU26DRAFT_525245 [Trematosphaeria pertusa]KAF2241423.1 hypothetical protein BU26DRAFT_525245 [Trematosphaeria pertusa]
MANPALDSQPDFVAMADAALGPQPEFAVMAAGCEETANTFTNMAAQIRNCQNLPILQRHNEIATTFQGIFELLNRIEERLGRVEERVERVEERVDRVEERVDRVEKRVEDVEEWVEGVEKWVERGFRRVEVHQLNNQARLENSHVIASNIPEDLIPLYSLTAADAQPQVILDFPSRIDDISQMDGGRVNELLCHLEQSTSGDLAQRRTRLKRAVGGFIRYDSSVVRV